MKKTDKTTPASTKEKRAAAIKLLQQEPALSNRKIAKSIKMSHTTVSDIRKEMIENGQIGRTHSDNEWLNHPYLKRNPKLLENLNPKSIRALKATGVLDKMAEKSIMNPVYAQRLVYKDKKRAAEAVFQPLSAADIIVKCDDVAGGLRWIADVSVDCIITDPPYGGQYIPLYADIASVAARVLKPQGLLIIMTGQSHLNKVMSVIGEVQGLTYHWTVAYLTMCAGSTYLNQLGVTPYWKPVLIYIKGRRQWNNRNIFSDVINTQPDKTRQVHHHWQQDLSGFLEIVKRFTNAGDTVMDCCCGSSIIEHLSRHKITHI